jgi:hypothetical protein
MESAPVGLPGGDLPKGSRNGKLKESGSRDPE